MILYGIGMPPLVRIVKEEHPNLLQPWYADDAGMGGDLTEINNGFDKLMDLGPIYGYYPAPSKSKLIIPDLSLNEIACLDNRHNFEIVKGHKYLGGYIGDKSLASDWIKKKVEIWKIAVETLSKIGNKFPQASFSGLSHSLQHEWTHMNRVLESSTSHFSDVENACPFPPCSTPPLHPER